MIWIHCFTWVLLSNEKNAPGFNCANQFRVEESVQVIWNLTGQLNISLKTCPIYTSYSLQLSRLKRFLIHRNTKVFYLIYIVFYLQGIQRIIKDMQKVQIAFFVSHRICAIFQVF